MHAHTACIVALSKYQSTAVFMYATAVNSNCIPCPHCDSSRLEFCGRLAVISYSCLGLWHSQSIKLQSTAVCLCMYVKVRISVCDHTSASFFSLLVCLSFGSSILLLCTWYNYNYSCCFNDSDAGYLHNKHMSNK